ncbi:MAG: histidine kinase [Chitinophagales bacterium]
MKNQAPILFWYRHMLQWIPQLLLFLLLFKPASADDTIPVPSMILRSVMVNTVEKRFDSSLCCRPGENNFEFRFEAIDLTFSGQTLFRYRIKESEPWKTTAEKNLLFPALSAGSYHFEAATKNERSNWSEPVTYSFIILSPVYQRWWFMLITFLLVVGITAWVVTLRNRQYLKKQQQEFIALQRMNEMENQAKQAMMNPHFIFNALNSIQQYINDNDRISANKYLTKFSRLIRLNLDLVNKSLITLEEELEKLKLYLEIEQLRFGEKLKYEFIIDQHLETDIIYIPSMILQPFVENSIWHGLMASSKGGKIILHAASFSEEKMLRIEIRDDGIGINQSKKLNQQKSRKSLGIELTIDRLKLFGKKYGKEATITFVDLYASDSLQHGTLVTIELPVIFERK